MKVLFIYVYLGLILCVFLPGLSQATTLRGLSLEQLAQRSDCVVSGRIVARRSEQRGQIIYTVNSLAVDEVLYRARSGRADVHQGQIVQVAQLGGQLGHWQMPVAGTAHLQPGDRQVLFLRSDAQRRGSFYIAGMSQGALKRFVNGDGDDDKLLWAATAPLLQNGRVQAARAHWLRLSQLRLMLQQLSEVQP